MAFLTHDRIDQSAVEFEALLGLESGGGAESGGDFRAAIFGRAQLGARRFERDGERQEHSVVFRREVGVQAAQFAFHFREPPQLRQRRGAARAGMALDEARKRAGVDLVRGERKRAVAAQLGFGQLAVEGPRPRSRSFQMFAHAGGVPRGEARARRPIMDARQCPAAMMFPQRRLFEAARRSSVIAKAECDQAELPGRLPSARSVELAFG
jgi:hypothetical protein